MIWFNPPMRALLWALVTGGFACGGAVEAPASTSSPVEVEHADAAPSADATPDAGHDAASFCDRERARCFAEHPGATWSDAKCRCD